MIKVKVTKGKYQMANLKALYDRTIFTRDLSKCAPAKVTEAVVVQKKVASETIPGIIIKDSRGKLIVANLNPHREFKGDCTTKAIYYSLCCIGNNMSYDQVWKLQHEIASDTTWDSSRTWNNSVCYGKILLQNGFIKVGFYKPIVRHRLARIFKDFKDPILTRSSGHIAVIHQGAVIDAWDSRGGRVKDIFIKVDSKLLTKYLDMIDPNGRFNLMIPKDDNETVENIWNVSAKEYDERFC